MEKPFSSKLSQFMPFLFVGIVALSIPLTVTTLKMTTNTKSQAAYGINGDVTGDGLVNLDDVTYIRYAIDHKQYDQVADLNKDSIVNEEDIKFFFERIAANN